MARKSEILSLAIPAIVSNITTPLLGLADTAITGRMGAAAYIGAIAVGGSMFSLAYWVLNFLRMGTSGLTAQAYGRQQGHAATHDSQAGIQAPEECALVLWRGLAVAAVASMLLIALSPLLASALLAFLGADEATSQLAREYFLIVVFGAPAVLGCYALSGWFLGMQDSRAPMWMALVTNVFNIALSALLVFGFTLKIEGVAIGTLCAQWVGLALGLWIAHRRYGLSLGSMPSLRQICQSTELKQFFSVNFYIFLRTLCLVAVTLWFTRSGARHGASVLAANALLMQLFILFSYFMDGFAFAGEALAGKYWGRADRHMLHVTIRGIFLWGAAIAGAFTLLYMVAGRPMLTLLTDDISIVDIAVRYLPWAMAVPVAGVAAFAWDGIFIGLSWARYMFISMLAATLTYFCIYAVCAEPLGNHGLWLAFLAYLFTRGAIQSILYLKKSL